LRESQVVQEYFNVENPFDEEDKDTNIIFLNSADINALNAANGPAPTLQETDAPQIKGATLPKLMERLTYDKYAGKYYIIILTSYDDDDNNSNINEIIIYIC
jgi:hypothetical protein